MFGINKGRRPALAFLHFRNGVQGQRGFPRTFRTVNFHHATAGVPPSRGGVQCQTTRTNGFDLHIFGLTYPHHTPPTVRTLNLIQNAIECSLFGTEIFVFITVAVFDIA